MHTAVLMSTYNGMRFLEAQLASIMPQLMPEDYLIIRDDGSADGTIEALTALSDPRIRVILGENIGASPSFLSLTREVPADADVILFADQDDVWLPGKIERARKAVLKGDNVPRLYCSRLQLVDIDLNPLGISPAYPRPPSFDNAVVENIVTGCTSALNRPALALVSHYGDPKLIFFHDWWCYLVVSAFGEIIFDEEANILYRQHGNNVVGMDAGLKRYLTILKFLRKHNWMQIVYDQNLNFLKCHGDRLPPEKRRELQSFFGRQTIPAAIRLMLSFRRRRQSFYWEILFRGWLIFDICSRWRRWTNEASAA